MDKKRILIIDDEANFTKVVKRNLEVTGKYEVRAENAGSRGIAAAKEFKPNVILLDIFMPGMDGGEVGYELGNDGETKNIPIIFLTAAVSKSEMETKSNIISNHVFVAKPIDIKDLIAVIEKWAR